ncbi:MAG TPA: hypothetical protein VJA27_02185 [Patescibacteria group bacterium]|nr:hypothetical protein [Patescibacteria group bacterium]
MYIPQPPEVVRMQEIFRVLRIITTIFLGGGFVVALGASILFKIRNKGKTFTREERWMLAGIAIFLIAVVAMVVIGLIEDYVRRPNLMDLYKQL